MNQLKIINSINDEIKVGFVITIAGNYCQVGNIGLMLQDVLSWLAKKV